MKKKKNKKQLTNDEKLKNIKKRKILLYFIFFFGLLTIVLAIHSLATKTTPIFALISFIIEAILSKYRNNLDPKVVNPDSKS